MDDKRDDKSDGKSDDIQTSRRDAIKRMSIVAGGMAAAIVLPSTWTKPVMDAVIGPVSARGFISFCGPDGTQYRSFGRTFPPGSPGNPCPVPPTTS